MEPMKSNLLVDALVQKVNELERNHYLESKSLSDVFLKGLYLTIYNKETLNNEEKEKVINTYKSRKEKSDHTSNIKGT